MATVSTLIKFTYSVDISIAWKIKGMFVRERPKQSAFILGTVPVAFLFLCNKENIFKACIFLTVDEINYETIVSRVYKLPPLLLTTTTLKS